MFKLPDLPFEKNALEPIISSETLEYHYWKHHKAYVDNLNKFTHKTEYETLSLEEVIAQSSEKNNVAVFNNSAQVWNHTFYWNCLQSPTEDNTPEWELLSQIEKSFWDFATFKTEFSAAAVWNFGSGWTWLAKNKFWELQILSTTNAKTLVGTEYKPLMVIDVWEHAYYVDFRNSRPSYVDNFWKLVNWNFSESNLK